MAARAKQAEPGKVLRIGIVQSGKVVQERLIRPGQNVTVGTSAKNTFALQMPTFPDQHTLFQAKGDRYFLNFNEKMAGKIAHKDGIVDLSQLAGGGDATKKGPHYVFPLDENNRGKIVIDDVTVLFQFVAAPPESARMLTKQDFRPKLLDEDDPVFLGFLALFSSIATVVMIWTMNQEPVDRVSLEEIPDRFVELVMPKDKPNDPPPELEPKVDETLKGPEVEQKEEPTESSKENKAPSEEKKPMTPQERAQQEARRMQQKKEDLTRKSAVLAMLGTRGENNNGSTVEDVFGEGDGNMQSLAEALNGVNSAQVATSDNVAAVRGQKDGGGRGDSTIGGIESGGTGTASVASAPAPSVPKANMSTGNLDVGAAEGVDGIKTTVRQKSGQVKYCYEQRLKENPNISGRLAVDVSISAGRVVSVVIAENTTGDNALEDCVVRKIRAWRFPEDAEGDISLPFALSAS